jgi:WD40 repeat protein
MKNLFAILCSLTLAASTFAQESHAYLVTSVAFSPDGKQVVSGAYDKTVKVWDAQTGKLVRILSGHTGFVNSVTFSPDGMHILSASDDETFKIWDANTGSLVRTFASNLDKVTTAAFSPDGK